MQKKVRVVRDSLPKPTIYFWTINGGTSFRSYWDRYITQDGMLKVETIDGSKLLFLWTTIYQIMIQKEQKGDKV